MRGREYNLDMTNTTATTLRDQITIRPSFLGADEQAKRGILAETVLSARVGRTGTERHAIHVTVWAATETREHPLPGYAPIKGQPAHWNGSRTYCGSQRGLAGASSYSMTAPVTCERCLGRGWSLSTESLPEDILVEGRRGDLVLKAVQA